MRRFLLAPLAVLIALAFLASAAVTCAGDWLTERLARLLDWCLHPQRSRADP